MCRWSLLPLGVTLLVPHGFMLGFYKCSPPPASCMQSVWAACQSLGTWTGCIFLLHWTKSHVDKLLQKSNVVSVLSRRSRPWKNKTNKFKRDSKVPRIITEEETCSSTWSYPGAFFLWIVFKNILWRSKGTKMATWSARLHVNRQTMIQGRWLTRVFIIIYPWQPPKCSFYKNLNSLPGIV